jgi:outer membrane protein TolC
MKKICIILLFITNVAFAQQQKVQLSDCYESMLVNYPIANQTSVYSQTSELNTKNLKAAWLPNAELNAQATYQSDVFELELDMPIAIDLPEMSKDQYKATIDINQMIYDWGRIKSAKQLENVDLKVKQQITQVDLNKVKEQINTFYFAILVLERNEELLSLMLKDLTTKKESVESAVKNGVLLSSDLSALKAEILKLKQSIVEIKQQRLSAIDILTEICGLEISYDAEIDVPEFEVEASNEMSRPENILFNYQREKLDAASSMLSKQNKPTVFAFSQLGYGKPGLNMLSEDFDSFYYLGVGLKWKFWDWNKTKRERQVVSLNQNLVSIQEKTFNKQMNVALRNELSKLEIYKNALESDKEVIKLREEVSSSARSKLDNGVITSTDYITELSKETQAKINYETHKIQMVQSKVNYLYLKGEL